MEHESDNYTKCDWCSWYSLQRIGTRTEWLRNNRTDWDCPNNRISAIAQNTENSPGDLRRHFCHSDWCKILSRSKIIIIKSICRIVDFAVSADHRVKLKENEKRYKYLDLAWEMKKLWNIKLTVIPKVIGALDTVTKGRLPMKIRGRVETIQTRRCWDWPE